MSSSRFYPHVSRLANVSPETVGVSFDFACECLAADGGGHSDLTWIVESPLGRLTLGSEVARSRPDDYRPLRAVAGRLRPARWGTSPVSVRLELFPWSSRQTEIGLIHHARGWFAPSQRSQRAYLGAAHAVLDELRRALEAPPADWLSRLAWGPAIPVPSPEGVRTHGPPVVAHS